MEVAVDKADVGVRMARQAYFPTVYANAAYQLNDRDVPFGRDNDGWMVGVNLRWELFDGMRRHQGLAKAHDLKMPPGSTGKTTARKSFSRSQSRACAATRRHSGLRLRGRRCWMPKRACG